MHYNLRVCRAAHAPRTTRVRWVEAFSDEEKRMSLQVGVPPIPPPDCPTFSTEESFERCSLLTAALAQLGFYLVHLLNCLNQLVFPSKIKEKNREQVGVPPIPPLDCTMFSTEETFEHCSLLTAALAQLGFYLVHLLNCLNQRVFPSKIKEKNREGYAPLYSPFEQLYSYYIYRRARHCFNWPVCSTPDAEITLKQRTSDDYNWTFRYTGRQLKCVNLGSYNYLGYRGGKSEVEAMTRRYGISLCSTRAELGSCPLHAQLEKEVADFLGVEAAVVVGNGFSTNSLMLPGLVAAGTLVLSDESNHASLIVGLRLSGTCVRVFRHNDVRHLEQLARQARAEARWEKIVIVLEGVYSMEGSLAALPAVIALKKRLGLHVYVDEAHSIGLGPNGRGATDACGVSPRDVDALMGSFSKSFPGAGGYIAGSAALVNRVRVRGYASAYAQSMPPPIAAQVLCALRDLRAPSGQARVAALKDNTRYFRDRLREMGVVIYGHPQSPVVPMMVYSGSKMVACVERLMEAGVASVGVAYPATPLYQARMRLREMGVVIYGHPQSPVVPMMVYSGSKMVACVERLMEAGVASVGVAYPATPLYQARMRFCLSAAHTREHLDKALAEIEAAANELGLRYSRLKPEKTYLQ